MLKTGHHDYTRLCLLTLVNWCVTQKKEVPDIMDEFGSVGLDRGTVLQRTLYDIYKINRYKLKMSVQS